MTAGTVWLEGGQRRLDRSRVGVVRGGEEETPELGLESVQVFTRQEEWG